MSTNAQIKKPGTVKKIVESRFPAIPEKVEITLEGADHLYREIRIENTLLNHHGDEVKLKEGAPVSVTIEADSSQTVPIPKKD